MSDFSYSSPGIPTRGRSNIGRRNEKNQPIVEFARMVGIRENEYRRLTGCDITEKNGKTYVIVQKGKGGKRQEQLIKDEYVEKVKKYFEGKDENDKIFTKSQMVAADHANLHALRRELAFEMYQHYKNMNQDDRKEIIELLRERYEQNPQKKGKFDTEKLNRPIYLRSYRDTYIKNGKTPKLDRFAVIAVSVLHLSHYREDVVLHHYFI